MPEYSKKSQKKLDTCHPDLQTLFTEVIKYVDCTILDGNRNKTRQNFLYNMGRSRVMYPDSKHNESPSSAIDAVPYPINWNDLSRFYYFGGIVMGIAFKMGIPIRWGGDWDRDMEVKDQNFNDLPHFELLKQRQTPESKPNQIHGF